MFESLLSIFLGRYSGVELLGHMVIAFLIFQGPATLFSRLPFFRNLSFVPMSVPFHLSGCSFSASSSALCPVHTRVPSLVSVQTPGPPGTWEAASLQTSSPIPGACTASSDLLSPRPLPPTFPCGSGFHPPININMPRQLLGLGRNSPSLESGVPHRRQPWAAGQSWGWQAGGHRMLPPRSRYTARGTGRGFTRDVHLSSNISWVGKV